MTIQYPRFGIARVCLVAGLLLSSGALAQQHPCLFLTTGQVAEMRRAVASSASFRALANRLLDEAKQADLRSLPPFERSWWDSEKTKGYMEVDNPALVQHTYIFLTAHANLALLFARAHLINPGGGFGLKGKAVLLKMADHTCEFDSVNAGLYYARPGATALEAYDILFDLFSAEEHKKIDDFYMRMLGVIQRCDTYWVEHEPGGPLNNHDGWHKTGLAMIGLFYARPELVNSAIFGPHGFDYALQHGMHDDGIWLEGSLPYHFTQLSAMLLLARMTHNAGYSIDLSDYVSADGRTLKQGYDAPIRLILPNKQIPPIGDGYGGKVMLSDEKGYEVLYSQFHEPAYAWLLSSAQNRGYDALFYGTVDLPAVSAPPQTTVLWPEHGLAALRSTEGVDYWSGRGWTLMATYGSNMPHHHADKLTISVFGDGHYWLPDAEAWSSAVDAFSAAMNQRLNWTTLSHNGVIVDWESQNRTPPEPMRLVNYENLPVAKRLTIGDLDGLLYKGVRQLRTCIVRNDYVLDVFQVSCMGERDLGWVVHVDGVSAGGTVNNWIPYALPAQVPWSFIREPEISPETLMNYHETFEQAGKPFRLDLWCDKPGEMIRCGYPRDDSPTPSLLPMRIFSTHAKTVVVVAVYRLGKSCDLPLKAEITPGPMNSVEITLSLGEQRLVHSIPALLPVTR